MAKEIATMQQTLGQKVTYVSWKGWTHFDGDVIICDLLKGGIGWEGHPGVEGLTDWTYQRGKGDLAELGGSVCHDPSEARMLNYLDGLWVVRRRGAPGPTNLPRRPASGLCRGNGSQRGCISLT